MKNNLMKKSISDFGKIIDLYGIYLIIEYESYKEFLEDLKVNMKHLLIPPVSSFCTDF